MSSESAVEYWNRYTEGWEERDPDEVMDAFAPGGTIEDPALDAPMAGDEIGDWVSTLIEGFPDVHFEEHRLLSTDQDGVIVVEWTMHGTHTGPFNGLPPTHRTVALDGVDLVTASENGIESIEIYYDQASIKEQLGLSFPTILGQLPKLALGAARNAI